MSEPGDQKAVVIREEAAIEQRVVPFEGDDLAAAVTSTGEIYISVSGMCAALGLVARRQYARIQRTPSLAKGLRRIPLKTKGGLQPVNCLRIDRIALWIAGIETERLKPEFQGKIEAYQDDLAPVATALFLRTMGLSVPVATPIDSDLMARMDRYEATIEQVVTLLERIAAQTDHAVELLELLTAKLTPAQKDAVQKAVGIIVEQSAGKPGEMTYAQIYAALKRRFQVGSYSEIAPERFEEALSYLREMWKRVTAGSVPDQQPLM